MRRHPGSLQLIAGRRKVAPPSISDVKTGSVTADLSLIDSLSIDTQNSAIYRAEDKLLNETTLILSNNMYYQTRATINIDQTFELQEYAIILIM